MDLSARTIAAYFPLPDGGFQSVQGLGTDGGTFELPALPSGLYYLRVGTEFLYTSARVLDVGADLLGRQNTQAAQPGTVVALSLANLNPWTVDDDLQMVSWNTGITYASTHNGYPAITANAPVPFATSLSDTQLDWPGAAFPLIEASQGDGLTIFQTAHRTAPGGISVWEATRGFTTTTLTMSQGLSTPVVGAFTTLNRVSATIDFRYSDFLALGSAVHPQAVPLEGQLIIDGNPGPLTVNARSYGAPDLVLASYPPSASNVGLALSYGNPLPAPWTTWSAANAVFNVAYSVALADGGVANPTIQYANISVAQAMSEGAIGPLVPTVTPPRALMVDTRSATGAVLSNVPTSPVVSWTAPATGIPTTCTVSFHRLAPSAAGNTRATFVGRITAPGNVTEIQVPPGLLVAGSTYFMKLTAYAGAGAFDPARPFQEYGYPWASAQAFSSAFKTR